ncbi:hypothetical protein C2845_PM11G03800 [Panicum miliaceum]|uniref:Uncharacterized protein n=1 Tax=Panicum miliaceum TaxID=4540 RepID=A0A3L6RQG2_PANMI|nr:hypothetical protein C2845_PM11G03800 [Panicum miliaceum]
MPAPMATILTASSSSPTPACGAAPARTSRSVAVCRPSFPCRCRSGRGGKKPSPGPTAPLLLLLPENSLPPWLDRCLHALAAAVLALALSGPPLLPAAHASSSVGVRSPLDATAYPCEDVRRYYAGLDGLAGDELRAKLAAVVSPHAALRYKDVWEALKILDAADAEQPEASSEVYGSNFSCRIEIYSQIAVPKILAGKPDGWNREHLWPRSYGLTYGPSLTDLHKIRPADVNANCEAAPNTETDAEKWAPPYQVRGDVARSLMYMAVSYGSGQKDGTPHLELSDSPSIQYANLIWRKPPAESSPFTGKTQKAWINEFHYENKGKDENENSLYAMATSRREPQPNARVNRGVRNLSTGLKSSESDQGMRRARSVPTSPDRRLSPSPASSSSNTCRPSSSVSARTTSSRSTSGSGSSSTHGKTPHSASSLASAKQANTMRRKVEKPGATSVWPAALATPNASSKDTTRTAKSPSTVQKGNLSTKPGIEKMATSSMKLKTQKSLAGPLGAGKSQSVSSTRVPGSIAKRRAGRGNYVSIQRTRSGPARQIEAPKIEEQDVELLMEFDETESISTSSIEEHLQERLPDPVDLQSVGVNSKPSYAQEDILEEKREGKDTKNLNACDNADAEINSNINILKEATSETELKEAVDETELKEDRWRKDDGRSNEATEEGRGKPIQERKNKVMALVGRFETAMSGRE